MYGEFYQILEENDLKVQKADKEVLAESVSEIVKLQNVVQKVEASQEKDKERFKKLMLPSDGAPLSRFWQAVRILLHMHVPEPCDRVSIGARRSLDGTSHCQRSGSE